MPRRNNREQYKPADLTVNPSDLIPRTPVPPNGSNVRRIRHNQRVLNLEHQAECRARKGINWNLCVVPGCGRASILRPWWSPSAQTHPDRRHHFLDVSICFDHALVVFDHMAKGAKDPNIVAALATLRQLRDEREAELAAERRAKWDANNPGEIYYVRVGELIKVGWTKNLYSRIKQYGASAVLLVHYPASRDDETYLHRQLRPALAKGREWYNDGPIIQRYLDEAIAQHGAARELYGLWTVPKQKSG